jgi:hypothetical protein
MEKIITETIPAKHVFNDTEKLELGQKLAQVNQKIAQTEDEKKRVMSDYKARLDAAQADANLLSANLTNGYDTRPTECSVDFSPDTKTKRYYRVSDGSFVYETGMTTSDFQMYFPGFPKKGAQ